MVRQPTTRHRQPKQRVHQSRDQDRTHTRARELPGPAPAQQDSEGDQWTTAIFFGAPDTDEDRDPATRLHARLEWIFLRWAWFSGIRPWEAAVRSLARTLRGLERADLIERRTLRPGRGRPIRRTFTLTAHGREVAALLSGESREVRP